MTELLAAVFEDELVSGMCPCRLCVQCHNGVHLLVQVAVGKDFNRSMLALQQRVNSRESIVGW